MNICIYPPQIGLGGPASFSGQLTSALRSRGIEVQPDPLAPGCAAVLVIGGSKRLGLLWQARRRGVRIVQRLNGMNWLHRRMRTGVRHYLRAEINNRILSTIRSRLAQRIIYQSAFSQAWWQRVGGSVRAPGTVIFNGVDLQAFSPEGPERPPQDHFRLMLVEGHLGRGGMDCGLNNAVDLLSALSGDPGPRWELLVAGDVPEALRQQVSVPGLWITWAGVVGRPQVAALDRSAHLLFSADLNAACPNSVIEALACGLPVAAYDSGALAEMVSPPAGLVVPYGGDVWQLLPPKVAGLAQAARQITAEQASYRPGARARAERQFDIQKIVDQYLDVILGSS